MIPKTFIYGVITGTLITYMLFAFIMMNPNPMDWYVGVRIGFCVSLFIACGISFTCFEELKEE